MWKEQSIPSAMRRVAFLLPASVRDRYLQEWHADWNAASSDEERKRMRRGMTYMAARLRLAEIGSTLFGSRGVATAIGGWVVLCVVAFVAVLLGGPVGLLLAGVVVVAFVAVVFSGLPTEGSHWSMVAGVILVVGGIGYVFAAVNASVDAADAGLSAPAWTNGIDLAAGSVLLGIGLFLAGAVMGHRRRQRPSRNAD